MLDPVVLEPVDPVDNVVLDPVVLDPVVLDPVVLDPVVLDPVVLDPVVLEPVVLSLVFPEIFSLCSLWFIVWYFESFVPSFEACSP